MLTKHYLAPRRILYMKHYGHTEAFINSQESVVCDNRVESACGVRVLMAGKTKYLEEQIVQELNNLVAKNREL